MKNLFIIHFQTLEKYPPIINFLRYAVEQPGYKGNIAVITTHPGENKAVFDLPGIKIYRFGKWKERSRLQRALFYFFFNLQAVLLLLKNGPLKVIYYETLSAFAPWFYKKWINKKAEVFIHYHEYTSPGEYATGMVLTRFLHNKEKQLYPGAAWISHTNDDRMRFFLRDIGISSSLHTYIMPNYPPGAWGHKALSVKKNEHDQIGFVHVGALSLQTMHTRQMAEFVAKHHGRCYWHIYSNNYDKEVLEFLQSLNAPNIVFKDAIAYDDLPLTLPKYDVGVILYTGATPNYIYNVPNKFFEYITCGLNIWFGKGMKCLYEFHRQNSKPWVQCVDFDHLEMPLAATAKRIDRIGDQEFKAEVVYDRFLTCLSKKS